MAVRRNVLPEKSVVVFARPTLPAGKRICTVNRRAQGLIDQLMASKALTPIESGRTSALSERIKSLDQDSTDLCGSFKMNFGHDCVAAFFLTPGESGVLVR